MNYCSVRTQERWQVQERDSKEKKNDIRVGVNFQAKGIGLMENVSLCLPLCLTGDFLFFFFQENFTFSLLCFFSIYCDKSIFLSHFTVS